MAKVILIGGGGHCKVVIDHLLLSDNEIVGILDDNPDSFGKEIMGFRVLGPVDQLLSLKKRADFAVIAITDPLIREMMDGKFREMGFKAAGFIHPSAVISRFARISNTAQICAGTIINPESQVENNAIINTGAIVEHDCIVGEYAHIAPSVNLMGNVRVGRLTMIGASSVIIPNLTVGSRVVIGAGSVVVRDVEDNSRYMGVPARRVRR